MSGLSTHSNDMFWNNISCWHLKRDGDLNVSNSRKRNLYLNKMYQINLCDLCQTFIKI